MLYAKKYKNIEIIINSRGAEQESLNVDGKEYIRSRDEFWNRKAPILFPIVGKLKDLKTKINGEIYSMGQHGFARDREFKLLNETEKSLEFILTWDDESLKIYPFKFNLVVKYTISENKLSVDIKIINVDTQDIYFNVGGHPGFRLPMEEGLKFSDYSVEFECMETFNAPEVDAPTGTLNFNKLTEWKDIKVINLDYKYFEVDAIVAPHLKSRSVKLTHNDKGIKFDYYGFNTLAIWTKPNAPFVCLEPWLGYADRTDSDFEYVHKDDIVRLKKNEDYMVGYSVEILK